MTTETVPDSTREERIAQLAAAAALRALPDYAGQIAELRQQLADESEARAAAYRLVTNYAEQLGTLQQKLDTERQARIEADAAIRALTLADLNLSNLERATDA